MPAKSKSQQRFMGMVHALQKGELSPSDVSDKVKDAANQMDDSDAKDYASTKHSGKPEKVAKEALRKLRETIRQMVKENPSFIENFKLKKEVAKRDYKAEYKKFQSSDKAKKYRAELNQYNRKKGTYGNGDGKDASHKGGKIVGFEAQSKNRGRAEKSRLPKEGFGSTDTISLKKIKEFEQWRKDNAEQLGYTLSGVSDIKNESTKEYGKSLEKIAKNRQLRSLSKKDRDTLIKISKLMKRANESTSLESVKENLGKRCTVKEVSKWLKTLEEFRYRKVRGVDARRVASFVNNGMNEEELPISLQKKWEHKKYGREKHLATKYVETVLNATLKESVNERKLSSYQKKAILIAIEMSGNMTNAVKKIERIKRGLSNDKKVKDALRLANESVNETKDHEGKMAKSQLERSMKYSKMIYNMIQNVDNDKDGGVQFPAWVQSKLTKSMDYLQSVYNYLDGKDGLEDKFQESVNETIEPQGNIKKVLDVAKNKQAKKIGGTLVDGTTANLMTQVWNKVNDKSKEKMNKMNTKQLTNLILKLWDRMGTPRV